MVPRKCNACNSKSFTKIKNSSSQRWILYTRLGMFIKQQIQQSVNKLLNALKTLVKL
jgi:hypothetical protein